MFLLDRRDFFKKVIFAGSVLSLSVVINSNFLSDYNGKFICENFYLMGTNGKIQVFSDNLEQGAFFVKKAINRIKELEYVLSKFSPYSDIGRINNNPHVFNNVSQDTLKVLLFGNFVSKLTNRYFDMGMGNLLSYFGIDSFVPVVGSVTSFNDMCDELFIFFDNMVKLNRKNSMIDLGGIGKGFALDECMKILVDGGIKNAAVEFGGDVRVFGGMPNNLPWKIFLDRRLLQLFSYNDLYIDMNHGSLAVSGRYLKNSIFNGYHHIIDPFSLKSKDYYVFLLVSGEECILCDALSTACFSMSVDIMCDVMSKFPFYSIKVYY